ncbi:9808_t:CDS:1, partial [Rhizophagus irregularis]
MSSTPSIEIDWSSTSQRSYVQLGDFTPPDNNSADILYNTERPALLSAKDILSLDIDDIYPYTYSTLHFEDNKTEYIYDDEVYFQQLLQANLNAEIEVISVLKNDKPFVDDTPLTPIQEINPMPPLDTAPLSDNLPIVENINPIPPLDTVPLLENLPIVENINPIPPLDTAPLSENLPIVENINPIPPLDTAPPSEKLPI